MRTSLSDGDLGDPKLTSKTPFMLVFSNARKNTKFPANFCFFNNLLWVKF